MNYIVVDFEWNQSMVKTELKNKVPFEIIEIGAVKLDENRQIIDTYEQLIKPEIYPQLHFKTKELTHITEEDLENGVSFDQAALDFLFWCGDDSVFCTWGNTDLLEFQRNLAYYKILDLLDGPIKYYNAQKIFRLFYSEAHLNSSLETAVEYFKIKSSGGFHRAVMDAKYTAEVFAHMDIDLIKSNFTVDYYQYPQWNKDEIHLTYAHYYKYISKGYRSKEEAMENKEIRATRCYICGKSAVKKIRWFSSKTKNYYCLAFCREHGLIRGKIKFKRMDDGRYIAVKTLRITDEKTADNIRQMKKEVTAKRREKRHKGNED